MTAGCFVVVPAAYVLLLRGQRSGTEVLLQLRSGTDYMSDHWAAAAAGHVERGETAEDGAHREAQEEIGVTDLELTFLATMQRSGGGESVDERVDFFFTARSWVGEPRIMEPDKCADLRWWRLDQLPDPVVPHERSVLQQIASGRVAPYQTFGFARPRRPAHPDREASR